jgi:hypothetical protein
LPMIQNRGETALVIAGAWNPAILTPAWVLHHGLGRPGSEEPVQITVNAAAGIFAEFPRFTLPEFTYTVRPDTLIITPPAGAGDEDLARLEAAAAAMLDVLPHTPVTGIGHNFEFQDADPDPNKLNVFTKANEDISDHAPQGWTSAATMIASSFRSASGSKVVNIQRQFDGASVAIKFNVHHPLNSVQQALNVLRYQNNHFSMQQNIEEIRTLVSELYGDVQ